MKKLELFADYMKCLEYKLTDFGKEGFFKGFKPYRDNLKIEEGFYLTIRCGLSGIGTYLNEFKDGKWQMEILDGSTTIAYRNLRKSETFENYCKAMKGEPE